MRHGPYPPYSSFWHPSKGGWPDPSQGSADPEAGGVYADLRELDGVRVGHKRVARLMRAAGLAGVNRRKGCRTTITRGTPRTRVRGRGTGSARLVRRQAVSSGRSAT
ncbi:transposase [Nonomuraea sp. NPDC050451]|uniref:transposase n=1 Tax=Nonomuraea sp. NPDC050451 TaxID=3364364 RepID=UPI0037879F12